MDDEYTKLVNSVVVDKPEKVKVDTCTFCGEDHHLSHCVVWLATLD